VLPSEQTGRVETDCQYQQQQTQGHTGGQPSAAEESFSRTTATDYHLHRLFKLLDQNCDGGISKEELTTVLTSLAEWQESELEKLMRCLDANSDGKVTLDEYMAAVLSSSDVVVGKLVSLSKNNWHDKPRAERTEWKDLLKNDPGEVKLKKRNPTTDKAILFGAVGDGADARTELLRRQPRALRLLLSSTFTDTNEERNYLLADVLPYLQEYARRLGGLEAQIVEMRWGIREQASDNHETSEICMNELERCLQESFGMAYVFIAAQKYGFRPFPNKIPREYFELLLQVLKSQEDRQPHDKELRDMTQLQEWFQLDQNEVAPEQEHAPVETGASAAFRGPRGPYYVLKSKAKCDDWREKFEAMQKALRKAAFELWPQETSEQAMKDPSKRHFAQRFLISVTEEEFTRGLLLLSEENRKKRALVIKRHIKGLEEATDKGEEKPEGQRKGEFIDLIGKEANLDTEAQKRLKAQIGMTPEDLVVFEGVIDWGPGINLGSLDHVTYLKKMADALCIKLKDSILEGAKEVSVEPDTVVEEAARHLRLSIHVNYLGFVFCHFLA